MIADREALAKIFDSYNWTEALSYASWTPDDVKYILALDEGENDGANWLMLVALNDGRYSFLSAGCDFTGWDCRASGCSTEDYDLRHLIQFGMGADDRERLNQSF